MATVHTLNVVKSAFLKFNKPSEVVGHVFDEGQATP